MFRFLLLALVVCAAPAFGELQWEKPWQEFHRAPDDDHLETKYVFRNAGSTPITIKTVKTSCGCTTARLEKNTYAPGEKGEVTARFNFGERNGAHRKLITVVTDDGSKQELNLVVFIHPVLTISPALVFWRVGQVADAQTVQLAVEPGTNARVKNVTSTNPRVRATLQAGKPGENYLVSVKPADTTQREAAEVIVQTDYPPDAPRSFTIHARIK